PEHAVMIRSLEVVGFATPGKEGASAVKESVRRCDVVGIRNHGFFSLGNDLHEAVSRLEVLEESAKILLAAREVGGVSGLTGEEIRRTRSGYGRE
ncbi:MAG TPA: class II aldolase/adducin family protein, partial [Nitrososphaerales archaeon]|nr:class II aldolase/adducin family protein [Nitrososphaerales archaeon]